MDTPKQTGALPAKQSAFSSLSEKDLNAVLVKFVPKEQPSPKAYIELVKTQIMGYDARGTARSIEDMVYFLNVAKRTGLDPLAKQLHPVFRWNSKAGKEVMSIQTGIDGFRLIAERSGKYGGQDDVQYHVEQVFNPVTGEEKKQLVATVTVYKINHKNGERMPVSASARWDEYVQKYNGKPMGLWVSMPYNQLGKCAEALCLRKAFPQELSGIHTDEEMGQADNRNAVADLPTPASVQEKKTVQPAQQPIEVHIHNEPKETPKKAENGDTKKEVTKDGDSEPVAKKDEKLQTTLLEQHDDLKKEGGAK